MASPIHRFGAQLALEFRDVADPPRISPPMAPVDLSMVVSPTSGELPAPSLSVTSPPAAPSCKTSPGGLTTFAQCQTQTPVPGISLRGEPMIGNLLTALGRRENPPAGFGTMRNAVEHACAYLGLAPEHCPLSTLRHIDPGQFKEVVRRKRYSHNTAKTYLAHVRLFVKTVDDLGWGRKAADDHRTEIEAAWREIAAKISSSKYKVYIPIVQHAVQQGKLPREFGDADLVAWANKLLGQHRTRQHVRETVRGFRRAVEKLQLTGELPHVSPAPPRFTYGVRFSELPTALRNEINELLEWKQAPYAPGRAAPDRSGKKGRQRGRHRAATALGLRGFFCRLYGFLVNAPDKVKDVGDRAKAGVPDATRHPESLVQLITPENVSNYTAWFVNVRGNKSSSLITYLVMLPGVFRHPRYAGKDLCWLKDLSWLQQIINDLPADRKSAIQERKQRKWVEYPRLRQIPKTIRAERLAMTSATPMEVALMGMYELMILWLTHLPWRQRNLRECKLMAEENGGNLFKAPLPDSSTMDVPTYVREALKENPRATFWQIYFREEEIKVGSMVVRMVVPSALVALLEEYIQHHRPVLVGGGPDPGTLFVTENGTAFNKEQIYELVTRLTYKYTGRSVNPHLFRDIFATYWLRKHPAEISVVSRALWHSNIQTTIDRYAWAFDTSHAQARIEECLKEEEHEEYDIK